jgi:ABC-type polysaccharide/polyol phosphate transport system ATPase subunit
VTSAASEKAAKGKSKGKGKSAAEGTELLSNAKLRLKAGSRYALVGRNGSGKSSKHPIASDYPCSFI